ncbi:TPA: hypothetical protein QDC51_006260 [Burkholderia multivorans]|uniref:hypothetical protein n=1 Tax=Burkholderia multivorans TaxID=87883 RepID=UPI001C22CFD8|nr:hypothetical protein [Burkholderia multivorans]MBU9350456.1 hypothetical protein [Burkholderia multivorans]MBU9392750.1 hypothetical protein [Burkholderia multivorans]HDR9839399.1 hypothetical protein [Burkholderia multivorans]HDR9844753.1 hypothetical protein [Burkholderia multivorans]HDR9851062.1 hypothetical protein [Burkholderia multivorans]
MRGAVGVDCRRHACRASRRSRILNDFALEKSSDLLATILVRSVLPRAAGELAAYAGLFRYFAHRTLKIHIGE